jgi:hypothetical protein
MPDSIKEDDVILKPYKIIFIVPDTKPNEQDLKAYSKTVRVKIVGHTDTDGNEKSNLDLSKRRATSIKNYFSAMRKSSICLYSHCGSLYIMK